MIKERLRKAIAQQTQEYLDAGGVIEAVSSRSVLPYHYAWMEKYGWDYMPWGLMGVAEYGHFLASGNSFAIGQGCYMTYAAPTEE